MRLNFSSSEASSRDYRCCFSSCKIKIFSLYSIASEESKDCFTRFGVAIMLARLFSLLSVSSSIISSLMTLSPFSDSLWLCPLRMRSISILKLDSSSTILASSYLILFSRTAELLLILNLFYASSRSISFRCYSIILAISSRWKGEKSSKRGVLFLFSSSYTKFLI